MPANAARDVADNDVAVFIVAFVPTSAATRVNRDYPTRRRSAREGLVEGRHARVSIHPPSVLENEKPRTVALFAPVQFKLGIFICSPRLNVTHAEVSLNTNVGLDTFDARRNCQTQSAFVFQLQGSTSGVGLWIILIRLDRPLALAEPPLPTHASTDRTFIVTFALASHVSEFVRSRVRQRTLRLSDCNRHLP